MIHTISIIGVGLLGASLGKAILSRKTANEVLGADNNPANLNAALANNSISRAVDWETAAKEADLIVLATPPGVMAEYIRACAEKNIHKALITDLGSVKSAIVNEISQTPLKNSCRYLGSHPMAGKEVSGAINADENLFDNCVVALTPTDSALQPDVDFLKNFWESLSCRVLILTARQHDQIVSQTSHLPHLLSAALMRTLILNDSRCMILSATGLDSMTRLSGGNPDVWTDILLQNRDNILAQTQLFRQTLDRFLHAIELNDSAQLHQLLLESQARREFMLEFKSALRRQD